MTHRTAGGRRLRLDGRAASARRTADETPLCRRRRDGRGQDDDLPLLRDRLDNSVLLDGDWLWDMHPFCVNDVTKKAGDRQHRRRAQQFLSCPALDNVVFCWVLHRQEVLDGLLSRLHTAGWTVRRISLVCTPEASRAACARCRRRPAPARRDRAQPRVPAAVRRAGHREARRVGLHAGGSGRSHSGGRAAMKQKLILITGSPCVGNDRGRAPVRDLRGQRLLRRRLGLVRQPLFRFPTHGCATATKRCRLRFPIICARALPM